MLVAGFIVIVAIGLIGFNFYKDIHVAKMDEMINEYVKPSAAKGFDKEYDVIVIGGEPEGVAAAVSAARNGAKTLLVESREELGGLFTYGMLNFLDIPQGEDGDSVSKGIYKEWHKLVGGKNAFGITEAKAAFKKLVDGEENITLSTQTDVIDTIVEKNKVTATKLKNANGEFEVKGKVFIDATQDADFAVMSDVPYFIGGQDIGVKDKKMAVTLMIHLENVDWKKIKETAKSKKFGEAEVNDTVAWGFADLHTIYKPVEENTRLRGLNLVKINDEYFINALQIFDVNGLDKVAKQEAIEKGKRETEHILNFFQKEFPGFENAKIKSFPTELYVRETRHIHAEYQLPMSDVWTNKDHWDGVGFGAYPVDVQAQTPHDYGYVLSSPKQYAIPFRSIVPKEIDGLLVVGRSAGFSSLAAGSARVVPTGMAMGEAAGVAAVCALEQGVSFRDMSKNEESIATVRSRLEAQGAFVKHLETDYPYKGEWYDQSIQTLINYGLIVGGYANDLRVEEPITEHRFVNMLKSAIERANPEKAQSLADKLNSMHSRTANAENNPIEKDEAAAILAKIFFEEKGQLSWDSLIEHGLMNESISKNIRPGNHPLQTKEVFAIIAAVVDYVKG